MTDKTQLHGEITIIPALNNREMLFIRKFSEMRHVKRHNGPYFVEDLIIETLEESNESVEKELNQTDSKTKNGKKKNKDEDTVKAKKGAKKPSQKEILPPTTQSDKYLNMELKKYPTDGSDIIDHDRPHDGKPGLWCRWTVNEEGTAIIWDGHEDFYNASDWLAYLINHFIGSQPMARTATTLTFLDTHTLNGEITGLEEGEKIKIIVKDNIVSTQYL
jgi:hypothetical protein